LDLLAKLLADRRLASFAQRIAHTQRRTLTELLAHLAEVEERRLHLEVAHSSMFAYCVAGLGMSEDEACRRIQLARLARKFPALYPELANGRISMSVALVLEPALSSSNHLELLMAARGNSVRQAREFVAARVPSPDVASSVRKVTRASTDKEWEYSPTAVRDRRGFRYFTSDSCLHTNSANTCFAAQRHSESRGGERPLYSQRVLDTDAT
jgi:hypothetical protein